MNIYFWHLVEHVFEAMFCFVLGGVPLFLAWQRVRQCNCNRQNDVVGSLPPPTSQPLHYPSVMTPAVLRRYGGFICLFYVFFWIAIFVYAGQVVTKPREQINFIFGIVTLVEGWTTTATTRRLPADSHRVVLSITLALLSLEMVKHDDGSVKFQFRKLWSQLSQVNALVMAFSIYKPHSAVAFLLANVMLIMAGIWVITLGVFMTYVEMEKGDYASNYFLTQASALTLVTTLVVAYSIPPSPADSPQVQQAENLDRMEVRSEDPSLLYKSRPATGTYQKVNKEEDSLALCVNELA